MLRLLLFSKVFPESFGRREGLDAFFLRMNEARD